MLCHNVISEDLTKVRSVSKQEIIIEANVVSLADG